MIPSQSLSSEECPKGLYGTNLHIRRPRAFPVEVWTSPPSCIAADGLIASNGIRITGSDLVPAPELGVADRLSPQADADNVVRGSGRPAREVIVRTIEQPSTLGQLTRAGAENAHNHALRLMTANIRFCRVDDQLPASSQLDTGGP